MAARRRSVQVEFTPAQLDAVVTALAYCTSGSPEDVGMQDNAEGRRCQRTMVDVLDALIAIRDAS